MGSAYWDWNKTPFAPGESPYHVKGTAYRGHLEYVARHIPGGIAAQQAALENPGAKKFFEQTFLAGSWYDLFPLVAVGETCARLAGRPVDQFLIERTRSQVASDITGVYRVFLKLMSPDSLAQRLPKLIAQYMDFGGVETARIAPNEVRALRTGIPAVIAPWYAIIGATYLEEALGMSGARGVAVRTEAVTRVGSQRGVELVDLPAVVRWNSN